VSHTRETSGTRCETWDTEVRDETQKSEVRDERQKRSMRHGIWGTRHERREMWDADERHGVRRTALDDKRWITGSHAMYAVERDGMREMVSWNGMTWHERDGIVHLDSISLMAESAERNGMKEMRWEWHLSQERGGMRVTVHPIQLGVTFLKALVNLKAQSSNVSFHWNVAKEIFELWALSFETAFENVTCTRWGL